VTPAIERVVEALRMLPGVGRKTAVRYAYAMLDAGSGQARAVSTAIEAMLAQVQRCPSCYNWTEQTPCALCRQREDAREICVVEQPADVLALEKTGRFRGLYHVLHGLLDPIGGTTLDDLTIDPLIERLRRQAIPEVVLALSPTREGEATSRLIVTLLGEVDVRITRLAYGVPMGSHLEYLDEATLSLALEHRRQFPEGV